MIDFALGFFGGFGLGVIAGVLASEYRRIRDLKKVSTIYHQHHPKQAE